MVATNRFSPLDGRRPSVRSAKLRSDSKVPATWCASLRPTARTKASTAARRSPISSSSTWGGGSTRSAGPPEGDPHRGALRSPFFIGHGASLLQLRAGPADAGRGAWALSSFSTEVRWRPAEQVPCPQPGHGLVVCGHGVEPEQRRSEHRRSLQASEAGPRCLLPDTGFDPSAERRVLTVEQAPTQHHFDLVIDHAEAPRGGRDHGHDFGDQDPHCVGRGGVPGRRGLETHLGQFEQPAVTDLPRVDRGEHGFGVTEAEVGGHGIDQPVGSPRPSRDRRARPSARTPSHDPPAARSPESSPREGKRTTDPSGPSPTQLSPEPHTTPTPHPDRTPARSTARESLSTVDSVLHPLDTTAPVSRSSSTGRSTPAKQYTPVPAAGVPPPLRPASLRAPSMVEPSESMAPSRPDS